uniref:ANF_receptor domain-containing protein n=1 Tax=Steinernema glaseri TaxID=37863 RepID=A0A1I8A4X1_9BILA
MDRVPPIFIEEVLLQINYEIYGGPGFISPILPSYSYSSLHALPSIWGQIVNSKRHKEKASLDVLLINDREAVFHVKQNYNSTPFAFGRMISDGLVPLANLDQFAISDISINDGDESIVGNPSYHPLTETNFKFLRKSLDGSVPCSVIFALEERLNHPVAQKLCAATLRITKIIGCPTAVMTTALFRSVERGTLRSFTSPGYFYLTEDILFVFLRFVASVQMEDFAVNIDSDSPISYGILLAAVIDAFLSRKRTLHFTFLVDPGTEHLCERLINLEECREVHINYNIRPCWAIAVQSSSSHGRSLPMFL